MECPDWKKALAEYEAFTQLPNSFIINIKSLEFTETFHWGMHAIVKAKGGPISEPGSAYQNEARWNVNYLKLKEIKSVTYPIS